MFFITISRAHFLYVYNIRKDRFQQDEHNPNLATSDDIHNTSTASENTSRKICQINKSILYRCRERADEVYIEERVVLTLSEGRIDRESYRRVYTSSQALMYIRVYVYTRYRLGKVHSSPPAAQVSSTPLQYPPVSLMIQVLMVNVVTRLPLS